MKNVYIKGPMRATYPGPPTPRATRLESDDLFWETLTLPTVQNVGVARRRAGKSMKSIYILKAPCAPRIRRPPRPAAIMMNVYITSPMRAAHPGPPTPRGGDYEECIY